MRATLVALTTLLRCQRLGLPIWRLWRTAATAWNEEPGEISISHLARTAKGDVMLDSLTHMRDLYLLLGVQQRLPEQSLQDEHRIPRRQGQRVSPDDPTVALLGSSLSQQSKRLSPGRTSYTAMTQRHGLSLSRLRWMTLPLKTGLLTLIASFSMTV